MVQVLLDIGCDLDWVNSWVIKPNLLAIASDEELRKVPWNFIHDILLLVEQDRVPPKVLEDKVCVPSIDDGLGHHVELHSKIFCCCLNLLDAVVLSVTKLVAGEGQNRETLVFVFIVDLNHLFIVRGCVSSFTGDIDHQE
jgi:hypothetical protein